MGVQRRLIFIAKRHPEVVQKDTRRNNQFLEKGCFKF